MLFGDLDGFNWSNKDRGALIMVLNTVTYKLIGEVPLEAWHFIVIWPKAHDFKHLEVFHVSKHPKVINLTRKHAHGLKTVVLFVQVHDLDSLERLVPQLLRMPLYIF